MNKNSKKPVLVFLFVFFFAVSTSVISGIIHQGIKVADPYEYTKIYTDTQGESHFEDVKIPFQLADFAPPAPPISVTDAINTEAFVLISSPSGWFGDWHPSPTRQYIFMISGELEAEVSDGEIRRFKKGDVVLLEDTTGKGHVTRVVSEQRVYCIAITLGSSSKATRKASGRSKRTI